MLTARNLRVEYKTNPLGMDEKMPRFSYELAGTSLRQSAYRIVVTEDGGDVVWDSGFVADSRCAQIVYGGAPFKKFTRYNWSVQVKDENGKLFGTRPEKAFFETGFMDSPWTGKWICARAGDFVTMPPQRLLRRFEITKKLVRARLYTAALGLYSAFINGKNVTEDIFTPGWTDYHKRVQYQAYDVLKLIKPGKNMLADELAEGWFCGRISRHWSAGKVSYGPHQLICQELHLTYEDGTTEIIASDEQYHTFGGVPSIKMSDIYMGETYDATEDNVSWKLPEKDNADEGTALVFTTPWVEVGFWDSFPKHIGRNKLPSIVWQSGAPVRRIKTISPVSIKKRSVSNTYVVDFGQNLTGRERIKLKKTGQGTVIVIRHGEMLNSDGSVYTANLRSAAATTTYIAANEKNVVYEPSYTYFGFRYVEISGWPGELKADQIEAVVIHSALEDTGAFECSNPLVNQLFSNIVWGQRGNFLDVPTDCPQRDERMGWTGDTQVFSNVATYNMFSPEFYTKWIHDLNSCQLAGGGYPAICPDPFHFDSGFFSGFATGWADAGIICPDVMLKKYGDIRLIRKYFDNMKRYLDVQIKAAGNSLIVNNATYGDWLNINDGTTGPLLSTAYLAGMSRLLAHHARLLGRSDDEQMLLQQYEAVKAAFRKEFFVKGHLKEKSQTAALLTLHFDLADGKDYKNTCADLVKSIKVTHKVHLSTGFLGTPLLLKVLTKIGEVDLAYELLQQTTYPGWLYPVTQGATTMWERWNSWNEKTGFGDIHMNSFNHYAYGAVGEWFYETICGIQPMAETLEQAGFHHFKLAPEFGKSMEYASAAYHSMYGLIASGWRRCGKNILWMFEVPCGTTAEVELPGAEQALLNAGVEKINGKFIAGPGEYQVEIVRD